MADNTAQARKALEGHRSAVRDHIAKWRRYADANDKRFAEKTIENAHTHIAKIKSDHPSLNQASAEDFWTPRNG